MAAVLTAAHFLANDAVLKESKEFQTLHSNYTQLASEESVAKAVKALQDKGHKATVVEKKEEALKLIQSLLPEGASLYCGGSTTLEEIGFIDYLIKNPTKYTNYKGAYLAAFAKGDHAAAAEAQAKGWTADYWFASVGAVAETGEIVYGSATGTRVAPHSTKNLVLVVGTHKITPDLDSAMKRLTDYQKLLADAQAREVFKVPGATLAEVGVIRATNPFTAPGRIHVVFVKEPLGF